MGGVVLRTCANREDAELLRGVLEANGVRAFVTSDDARGLQPALELVRGVRLLVAEEDEARAREILQAMSAP